MLKIDFLVAFTLFHLLFTKKNILIFAMLCLWNPQIQFIIRSITLVKEFQLSRVKLKYSWSIDCKKVLVNRKSIFHTPSK